MSLTNVIGDFEAFFLQQLIRVRERGMDIPGCEKSHFAYRTATYDEYLIQRDRIEEHCNLNIEKEATLILLPESAIRAPQMKSMGFHQTSIPFIVIGAYLSFIPTLSAS